VSFLDSFLLNAENGTDVLVADLTLPNGSSTVILGVLLALMLILRPGGITGGREASLPFLRAAFTAPPPPPGASHAPDERPGRTVLDV